MKSSAVTNEAIARSASRLRWVVFSAMIVMGLLYFAARSGLQIGQARVEYQRHGGDARAVGLIGDILVILLLVALYQLTAMLRKIGDGELFTAGVIGRFRAFALWLLLSALFGLLAPFGLQLLGPYSGGGHRFRLVLDFREIITVGVTLVLFLLARLLERARRLDEEVREFV
jgi:hypothetical protein